MGVPGLVLPASVCHGQPDESSRKQRFPSLGFDDVGHRTLFSWYGYDTASVASGMAASYVAMGRWN